MASKQRILTVIIGSILFFSILTFTPTEVFIVITYFIALLALNEFLRMCHIYEDPVLYSISISIFAITGLLFLFPFLRNLGIDFTLMPLAILSAVLMTQKPGEKKLAQIAAITLGSLYVGFLLHYVVLIRLMPHGLEVLIVLSVGTWGRNVGSFLSGRLMRCGHTMLPEVSPRKTYEGAVGGLIFTIIFVSLMGCWLIPTWLLGDMISIGFLIGIFGQIGDLVESWVKRSIKVIDSSQILPGQGGVLDSVDSLIFTAPVVYFYLLVRIY